MAYNISEAQQVISIIEGNVATMIQGHRRRLAEFIEQLAELEIDIARAQRKSTKPEFKTTIQLSILDLRNRIHVDQKDSYAHNPEIAELEAFLKALSKASVQLSDVSNAWGVRWGTTGTNWANAWNNAVTAYRTPPAGGPWYRRFWDKTRLVAGAAAGQTTIAGAKSVWGVTKQVAQAGKNVGSIGLRAVPFAGNLPSTRYLSDLTRMVQGRMITDAETLRKVQARVEGLYARLFARTQQLEQRIIVTKSNLEALKVKPRT